MINPSFDGLTYNNYAQTFCSLIIFSYYDYNTLYYLHVVMTNRKNNLLCGTIKYMYNVLYLTVFDCTMFCILQERGDKNVLPYCTCTLLVLLFGS